LLGWLLLDCCQGLSRKYLILYLLNLLHHRHGGLLYRKRARRAQLQLIVAACCAKLMVISPGTWRSCGLSDNDDCEHAPLGVRCVLWQGPGCMKPPSSYNKSPEACPVARPHEAPRHAEEASEMLVYLLACAYVIDLVACCSAVWLKRCFPVTIIVQSVPS
jgi:hypothetical protein